jgi:hypothetical protein
MASPRKKALEDFAKDVEKGIPLAEDYVGRSGDVLKDALRARNLAEEALAQKVLDNTGIPIPDMTSSVSKKEDFLNRILQERYPEIKKPIELKDMADNAGEYFNGRVSLNKNLMNNRDIVKLTSDVLHEGGHGYDDVKKLASFDGDDFNKELRRLRAEGFDLKNADPAQVYELMAGKHHAKIPKLREGTYGLGALKSYLKSGTFKGIAPMLAKGAAVGAGGLASLAAEASDAEDAGGSSEQAALLREIDQSKREKKMLEAVPEQNRQAVQEDLDQQRLGLRRTALQDLLRNK